ncbi:hypothetical protein AURDEDRAFT_130913 [Auricularia subglabra TFB-10046 SS5]|uniref:F-box domain-containing protein n=1 Tax=Auricularia subglabra (strain TFB-10046 / SS5) TaxID=717982 RepID=J0CWH9_AURST|nr:hypothetical protein AURDEDRAFT_130913 [Auricularia subglabra TFB-10046 SS5]
MQVDDSLEPHAVFDATIYSLHQFHDAVQAMLDAHRSGRPEIGALLHDTARLALPAITALNASRSLIIRKMHVSGRLGSLQHDVLAMIFKTLAQLPGGACHNHQNGAIPVAYATASVNRHWRAVALATPSIWTRATLDFEKMGALATYIEVTLSRSGACPLHVDVLNAQSARRSFMPDSLLATLLSRCGRLSIAWDITKDDGDFSWSLLQALQMPMPLLEYLELSGIRTNYIFPNHTFLLTLCPRLKTLKMDQLRFSLIQPSFFTRLENFAIKAPLRGADLEALVAACPLLATLEVDSFEAGVPVTLPRLTTLACDDADEIFRSLPAPHHVPLIQHLLLDGVPELLESFRTFLSAGPCTTLTTLEIGHKDCAAVFLGEPEVEEDNEPWKFLELLPKLPNVSTLRLRTLCDHELSMFLETWQAQVRLVPKLCRLELYNCSLCYSTAQVLVGFLAARKQAELPVADIEIVQRGELACTSAIFPTWMQPRMEQLVTGNISIDVSTASIASFEP